MRPLMGVLLSLAGLVSSCAKEEPPRDTFPPEGQVPSFERGLIVAPDSVPCAATSTSPGSLECNHHGSSVVELSDGTIAVVWYHGKAEKSKDSRLLWSKLPPGASQWTAPEVLFDDPGRAEGNPAIWVSEAGEILVFFVTIAGAGWSDARPRWIRSSDQGRTWSAPITLFDEACRMVRSHPLRLRSGELMVPIYNECIAQPLFLIGKQDLSGWEEIRPFEVGEDGFLGHVAQIQPAVFEREDGTLVAVMRNGTKIRRMTMMTSSDVGRTWTRAIPTGLPNPGSSLDQVQLLDGHVAAIFNNSPFDRFPLTAALSVDGGETYTTIRDLLGECDPDLGGCSYHYPSVTQSKNDGSIWVSYTHDRRTIGWVHFNEAWLLEGAGKSVVTCLPGQTCEDGACVGACSIGESCTREHSVPRTLIRCLKNPE